MPNPLAMVEQEASVSGNRFSGQMGGTVAIFISYRRTDSLQICRSMANELMHYFGRHSVFFDETAAPPGAEWPLRIQAALSQAKVFLLVIGPQWLRAQEETSGRRRIDLDDDWVRQEIIVALRRRSMGEPVKILPVLVGNTSMPSTNELDKDLGVIADIQAVHVQATGTPDDFDDLKAQLVRCGLTPIVLPPVSTPRLGKVPPPLTEADEARFLAELREWDIVESRESDVPGGFRRELHRVYEFATFDGALQFINEVAVRGIQTHNHHPRWQNAFNRVEVWLTTFNLGYKPSTKDVRLARVCEEVWRELRKR